MCRAVGQREPLLGRAGELPDELGAVTAGLLVLPLAGHERRHLDLVDERHRVERVGDRRVVVRVRLDLRHQVGGFGVEHLVGRAGRVAGLDPVVRPRLPRIGTGRQRLVLALPRPLDREAVVEDAAGVQRRRSGVEHRQRRDGGERRRLEPCGEQLADPAVRDAHHPDLVVLHPGLPGDGLDDVVAVEALQRLEEVEGATGAPGAAHVHVDDREAHQVREHRDAARRPLRVRVAVAGVLDQRGVRREERKAGGKVRKRGEGRDAEARRACRRVHAVRELRPVPGREVAVAAARDRLVVHARVPGRGPLGADGQLGRERAVGDAPHTVARPLRHVAEQEAAERARALRLHDRARAVHQRHRRGRRETGHVHLARAADCGEAGCCRGGRCHREHPREQRDARHQREHPPASCLGPRLRHRPPALPDACLLVSTERSPALRACARDGPSLWPLRSTHASERRNDRAASSDVSVPTLRFR